MEQPFLSPRLPASRTPLIGRERERVMLRHLVLHADERLLTLTGVGGCGKTRLALQLATDLAPVFAPRVWLVELAPITDPALVPIAIADALGLRGEGGQTPVDIVSAFLAPQPALLVLDNCEHLIDACAALADHLLIVCPALRLLATSREPLQIAGERRYRIIPLALPDTDRLPDLDMLACIPAVHLFVARAQAIEPDFHLTAENAPLVARVCARLDGIPLAIELAAPWVRVLALDEILARLDDSVRLLVGGSRAGATRQQTLRATLDWSDDLLTAAERVLFHRLAVFAGTFTLVAVEAVCAAEMSTGDLLETLTRLVDKSLVIVDSGEANASYRLLEPVRQYALQHLAAHSEIGDTEARHATFYLALAESAAPSLHGAEQDIWLARLEREQGNLRAALGWALERVSEAESGLRLATALVPFWDAHGHLAEGRRWLELALAAPSDAVTPTLRTRALLGAGRLAFQHSAYGEATTLASESLALARALGDERGIAAALTDLGMVYRLRDDPPRSTHLLEEGLARYRALGDEAGIAFALLNLGSTVGSKALVEESITRHQALGDLRHIAIGQALLGRAEAHEGNDKRAIDLFVAALRGHTRLGDRWFAIFDLMGIAEALLAGERTAQAVRLFAAAQGLAQTLGSPVGEVTYERMISIMTRLRGDERFAASWAEGAAMSYEQAVAAALALASPAPRESQRVPSYPPERQPLTRREREIAQLLARGDSNREIAEALFIGVGTVSVHVHRILQKLGLYSRQQVADWLAGSALRDRDD